jgi:hypothetical protein
VPVKRSWSAVNPVSKGDPLCASAAMGKRSGSATIRIVGHQRQRCFSDSASEDFLPGFWVWRSEILCGIIGTSDGPDFAVMCQKLAPLFRSVQDFLSMAS